MLRRYLPIGAPIREMCERDQWIYDARYTGGKCPICGTPGAGLQPARPGWAAALQEVPWDLITLAFLFAVLLTLGLKVAVFGGLAPGLEHSPLGRFVK
jgi:hypothetical protein